MLTDEEKQEITTVTQAIMRGEYQRIAKWWEIVGSGYLMVNVLNITRRTEIEHCVTRIIAAAKRAAPNDQVILGRAGFLTQSLVIAQNMFQYGADNIERHHKAAALLETLLNWLAKRIDGRTEDTPERRLWAELTNVLAYHAWKGTGKKAEERDHDLIIERFNSARNAGSVAAAVNLVHYYYEKEDYTTAREYAKHELAVGQPGALLLSFDMYGSGLGGPADRVVAADCLDYYLVLSPPPERDVTVPHGVVMRLATSVIGQMTITEKRLDEVLQTKFSTDGTERLIACLIDRLIAGVDITRYAKDWLQSHKDTVVTYLCSGDDAAIKLATAVAPNSPLNNVIQSFGSKSKGSGLFSARESYVEILQKKLAGKQVAVAIAQLVADVEMATIATIGDAEESEGAGVGGIGISAAGLTHRSPRSSSQ